MNKHRMCSTCKHWDTNATTSDSPHYRSCNSPKTDNYNMPLDGMAVCNGEPCNSGLIYTGPGFSCTNWEKIS